MQSKARKSVSVNYVIFTTTTINNNNKKKTKYILDNSIIYKLKPTKATQEKCTQKAAKTSVVKRANSISNAK